MDNRIFNVNGSGSEMLRKTLELVFEQEGRNTTCSGWIESKTHGLILLWGNSDRANKLPAELTAEQCVSLVEQWLKGDFAKTVELSDMCGDLDHAGDNAMGWQVYCESWGHVADESMAICGIKPAFMWLGK